MNDTTARLLRMLSLLQTGREWPGSELASRLEISPRTVRRDVDRLRQLGYPVNGSLGTAGGYRLVAGTAMPPLLLDDDEAVAIAVGLRVGAGHAVDGIEASSVRALSKVLQVLPARLRREVETLGNSTPVMSLDMAAPSVNPDVLTVIASAITNRERLRFEYTRADGTEGQRRTDACGLVSWARRWYLVGFDIDRDEWRTFRVDRVQNPVAVGGQAAHRSLPASSPAEYFQANMLNAAPVYRAVAVLQAPMSDVMARLGDGGHSVRAINRRSCRVHLEADTLDWLVQRLVVLGCDFVVEEPDELIEHVRHLGQRLVRSAQKIAK